MVFLHDSYDFGLEYERQTKKGEKEKKSNKTPALQIYTIAWKTLLMAVSHFYNRKFSQAISRYANHANGFIQFQF